MLKRSQNARRHGVQAEPPKSLVLVHIKYILGFVPDAGDLICTTPKLSAAMHLAACDATLDQAHADYLTVQITHRHADHDDLMDSVDDQLYHGCTILGEVQETVSRILNFCSQPREKAREPLLARGLV